MTLPYTFASPAHWADGSCVARADGNVDVTFRRPVGNTGAYAVWMGQDESDSDGALTWDLIFGPAIAYPATTWSLPNRIPITASNPVAYMRIIVRTGIATWPGGIDAIKLAETPISALPAGFYEVLSYGTLTYGALNPALPITSFTARPASAIRLDKRIGLDGGAP